MIVHPANLDLAYVIGKIHTRCPKYGYRRVYSMLKRLNVPNGSYRRVRAILKQLKEPK